MTVMMFAGCSDTSEETLSDTSSGAVETENVEAVSNDETRSEILYTSAVSDQKLFEKKIDYTVDSGKITKLLSNVKKGNAFYYKKGEFVSTDEFAKSIINALPHQISEGDAKKNGFDEAAFSSEEGIVCIDNWTRNLFITDEAQDTNSVRTLFDLKEFEDYGSYSWHGSDGDTSIILNLSHRYYQYTGSDGKDHSEDSYILYYTAIDDDMWKTDYTDPRDSHLNAPWAFIPEE